VTVQGWVQIAFYLVVLTALTPVLENVVPAELIRDFQQSVASLQLAYAQAAASAEDDEPG